ncbi:MAG: glutamate formimidoyltransferase [Deltaproteobacteria bacterium]|nr:glutamate formimidoyltransferase [Deltaproteobacteria bacterium]
MSPIVECVPNFSEGRDEAKIKQITDAIESVPGVILLDVDPGADTNRTVVTFIGSPDAVAEGAFQGVAKAASVIDMSVHSGAHPRMGATDVCPFVPVEGITLDECAEIARRVGRRIGSELQIPVYLYEAAASQSERKNLAEVRKGEYEGLPNKLQNPAWVPDYGPARFSAKSGATICGAREFLIAYNVTLNTRDKSAASDIALELRERGRQARKPSASPYYSRGELLYYSPGSFPCGNCDFVAKSEEEILSHCQKAHNYDLKNLFSLNGLDGRELAGKNVLRAGLFSHCKAIGWVVDEYKRAQISINLTNYHVTPVHVVLEKVRQLASQRGLVVTGSEVVGLIPFRALYEAGGYYLKSQGRSPFVPLADVLECAVFSMGLNDVSSFNVEKKVIGLPKKNSNALVSMTVRDFVDEVSRDTPAPGGGSISALVGALGAALTSMVANLTQKVASSTEHENILLTLAEKAQCLKDDLVIAVDADTQAFNGYLEALRLPQQTEEQKTFRHSRMQDALKSAIEVPFQTASKSLQTMQLAAEVCSQGNPNSVTDGAVGVAVAYAGVRGGVWNVLINLKDITDGHYIKSMRTRCQTLLQQAESQLAQSSRWVDQNLESLSKGTFNV